MSSIKNNKNLIIADAHVHINDCFDLEKMLNASLANFQQHSQQQGYQNNFTGILFLTETKEQDCFNQLAQGKKKVKNWSFQPTSEKLSLYAHNNLNQGLFLIAGCQIITAENLEVLALITEQKFEYDLPLKATIQAIITAGGIPILPWGVGKWIGKRGKILTDLLQKNELSPIFLGDNSGRPNFWLRPRCFQQAETKGIKILPGSDPLPLVSEYSRPGSFGFTIQDSLSCEKPGNQIEQMLLDPQIPLQPYGSLENPWRFLSNQLAIRYRKNNNQNFSKAS
ncbi:conserved hypothetical protein [Hyella patelloides LEGE 07179]|uniref:Uncharacterized protein n=1 Tax=Hyella patelloides LEGE 07179 TaxID=945734 RepID=A0A563VKG8_9CYAN|nr:hypothetical protein [Hyella patelloides]VEP11911.1 conserved hypothetical protein [Hyella patelloides LEGE 07179]